MKMQCDCIRKQMAGADGRSRWQEQMVGADGRGRGQGVSCERSEEKPRDRQGRDDARGSSGQQYWHWLLALALALHIGEG